MKLISTLMFALGSTLLGISAHAQVLVFDSFTDTAGTDLSSHTPDTYTFAPSGVYYTLPLGQPTDTISSTGTYATASASSTSLLNIAAPTGYVTASADIMIGTLAGTASQRGIFLGFNVSGEDAGNPTSLNPDSGGRYAAYAGIVVTPTGGLELQNLGSDSGTIYTPLTTTGTNVFNPNAFETLSYSVDANPSSATFGQIENLEFNGNSYDTGSLSIFAGNPYEYNGVGTFGYYSSGDAPGEVGGIDNLELETGIQAVPEPSSLALLLASAGALVFVVRRRRGMSANV